MAELSPKKKSLFGKLARSRSKKKGSESYSWEADMDVSPADHDAAMAARSVGRDGAPVVTSYNAHLFQPSDVRDEDFGPPQVTTSSSSGGGSPTGAPPPMTPDRSMRSNRSRSARSNGTGGSYTQYTPDGSRSSRRGSRMQTVVLDRAPTARESAFSGPPRYDWVDIVSRADYSKDCFGSVWVGVDTDA